MSKIPNYKNNIILKKTITSKDTKINKKPLIDKEKVEKMSQERILQKNVVYVIGLSYKLANKELLQKPEYFGQYGNITKILTNKTKGLNNNTYYENCYSSYIYYSTPVEASLAILAVDNFKIENHYLKTSFGRTKYCSFFLRNLECLNKECFYLHKFAEKDDIITGDDSKVLFHDQHIQAIKIANLLDPNLRKKIINDDLKKSFDSIFPKISTIYSKAVFLDCQEELNKTTNVTDSKLAINNNFLLIGNKNLINENNFTTNNSNTKQILISNIKENGESILNEYKSIDKEFIGNNDIDNNNQEKNKKEAPKARTKVLKLSDILKCEKKSKINSPCNDKSANFLINNENNDNNTQINISPLNLNNNKIKKETSPSLHSENFKMQGINNITINIDLENLNNSFLSKEKDNNEDNQNNFLAYSSNHNTLTDDNQDYFRKTDKKFSESSNYSSSSNCISNNTLNNSLSCTGNTIEKNKTSAESNTNNHPQTPSIDHISSIYLCNYNLQNSPSSNTKNINCNNYENTNDKKSDLKKNIHSLKINIINQNDSCINEANNNKNKIIRKDYNIDNLNETCKKNIPKTKEEIISEVSRIFITGNQSSLNDKNSCIIAGTLQSNYKEAKISDPSRSTNISSTSCSVSPNISYNQENENTIYSKNNNSNTFSESKKIQLKTPETNQKRRSFYTKRDFSRFDFVLSLTNEKSDKNNSKEKDSSLSDEIPEFIFEVLNKKISRFSFFKRFEKEYDINDSIFLEKKISTKDNYDNNNRDDSWADFIKLNLNA